MNNKRWGTGAKNAPAKCMLLLLPLLLVLLSLLLSLEWLTPMALLPVY